MNSIELAIKDLQKAVKLNPEDYKNYITLGNYCIDNKNYQDAVKYFEEHNKYCSNNPQIYDTLGVLYSVLDRYDNFELRINYFKKALKLNPDDIEVLRHLAMTYRHAGDDIKCMEYFEKILQLNPMINDYFDYSIQKLKLGDFKEGLKYYEYRFTRETNKTYYLEFTQPKWDGKTDLKNKTLLVQREQGHGDSIQFIRYLPMIKAEKIIFRVQDSLVDLFKQNFDHIEFIPESVPIKNISFDYHIAIESLLYALNATTEGIPLSEGYIKANEKLTKKYKTKFFDNDCLKIGIAWCGILGGNDYRNIDLKSLISLTKLKNVKVYSLQKETRGELEKYLSQGVDIVDLGSTFRDFSDTAAAIANLDILIASDNVVANLAGAMGKKTFLLLNKDSNWRWFADINTSLWYDSFQVFRKDFEKQPWDDIVKKVIGYIN